MMPNIVKGADMGGLLRYLAGPGRAEEHTNPQVIAGDVVTMAVFGGAIDVARATEMAKLLDSPRQTVRQGRPVLVTNHKQARALMEEKVPREEAFAAATKDENAWHCSLALDPSEGELSKKTWAKIATRFMEEMGFVANPGGAPDVRWGAVHHGLTKNGGDHIHIAMGVVRPDGSLASMYKDWPRSQAAARVLEKEFGLKVLASREHGATEQASRPDERARAVRVGAVETDRDALRRRVRAAAMASETEAEFVRELRAEGVVVAARWSDKEHTAVTGYKVRMPAQKNLATGRWEKAIWFAPGTQLAKDLSLPSLRSWAGWPDTAEARQEALAEWDRPTATRSGRSVRPDRMSEQDAIDTLGRWSEQMRAIPVEDRDGWARAASQTAGLFAAASLRTETTPGPLDRLSRQLARAGQLPAHRRDPQVAPDSGAARSVARLLWASRSQEAATLALVTALADCMVAVLDSQAAAGRADQAQEMAGQARQALVEIHKRAVGLDPYRPHVRETGSPAWAAEQSTAAILRRLDRTEVNAAIREQHRLWDERRATEANRSGHQQVDPLGHPVGPKPTRSTRRFIAQRRIGVAAPTDNTERITVGAIEAAAAAAASPAEAARTRRRRSPTRSLSDPRLLQDLGLGAKKPRQDRRDERLDKLGYEDDWYDSTAVPEQSTPPKSTAPEREWEQHRPRPVHRQERGAGFER